MEEWSRGATWQSHSRPPGLCLRPLVRESKREAPLGPPASLEEESTGDLLVSAAELCIQGLTKDVL